MNNRAYYESLFLDYVDDSLSEEQRQELETALRDDAQLQATFDDYCALLTTEADIAAEDFIPAPHFVDVVMDEIGSGEVSLFRRYIMELTRNQRFVMLGLSSLAVAVVAVKLGTEVGDEILLQKQQEITESVPAIGPRSVPAPLEIERKQFEQTGTKLADLERDAVPADVLPEEAPKQKSGARAAESNLIFSDRDEGVAKEDLLQPVAPALTRESRRVPAPVQSEASADGRFRGSVTTGRPENEAQILGMTLSDRVASAPKKREAEGKGAGMVLEDSYSGSRYMDESYRWSPPVAPSRDRYVGYDEQPRIRVTDNPVSTFSIDVDTGSYTNARRSLQQGILPPVDSIRIEEFINYFDYNYPAAGDLPFTFNYEIAPSPLNEGRYLVSLGVKAVGVTEERKPWNLVFLIDVSGSMNTPMKLDLVKRSLRVLVNNMQSEDRVALVTYAGSSRVALESTTVKEKHKILSAIDSLQAGGSTFGSSGIELAYSTAQQNFKKDGVNRIVLTTDGDFNVGVTSHDALVKLIEAKRNTGITLTTVGVGTGNLNDGMMEQIANKGNGNYFYLDTFKEGRRVFADKLASNMEVVAKDVKLQIEFNPASVIEYRLIGYDNRRLNNEDFNNDKIDAGEIGAGHNVTALYEVVLADTAAAKRLETELRYQQRQEKAAPIVKVKPEELGFLKIRYKEPAGSQSKLITYPLQRSDVKENFSNASGDFRFASAVAGFAALLRDSKFVDSLSFDEIIRIAEGSRGEDPEGIRREFVELVKNARSLK